MVAEAFSEDERRLLAPYFTNIDGPVFVLRNLPEVVKGALFARYSRSAKSLRRLFLDEFLDQVGGTHPANHDVGVGRADKLYERVFDEYGDDSVAQLGGAHLACEGASNLLTKVLEWGRLMAYLEQSTRYIAYNDRRGGRWKYLVPAEITDRDLRQRYTACLDRAFETYARWLEPIEDHYRTKYPRDPGDPEGVYKRTIRAKALDTLRGLLPAATQSNVGLFGTGQAYEALLLRMRVHPLQEVRTYADLMLDELRQVIPSFLKRVDRADRGVRWSEYLQATQQATATVAQRLLASTTAEPRSEVMLTDFDPDGEAKVVAAALYAVSALPDDQLLRVARTLSADQRGAVLRAYVGQRDNRRHKPGRAFERTTYRFDVLTDYGAFRDLQRHRLLTLEWQPLSPRHGYSVADAIEEAGALPDWQRVMEESAALYDALLAAGLPAVAPYAVSMAYRVRFYMEMNAREAMHMIELRTAPQGHPSYRRVCQAMHRLIAEQAGHRAIAAAMVFADHSAVELERLGAERASEQRRHGRR
ncbi:MAG TPA: FAD-dependent thymidylate synthase [Candidatus Margulisiibacteriota bacterium]|nr:FAD-dependent thymidylate synthase [Candidatus Margulisiibacteriota bacterium]